MKTVLHIIAILVLLAAAFFGFQLKGKYETQLAETADLVGKNKVISKAIDDKKTKKGEADQARGSALEARNAANAELELATAKGADLKNDLARVESRIEEAQAELDNVNKLIAEMQKAAPGIGIDELPGEIERLKADKVAKQKRLDELDLLTTKLSTQLEKERSDISRERALLAESRERVRSSANFQATVTAVNNDWGFVVVGAGANSGLTGNSKLLVQRGGRLIGKLSISKLENNQTIAEVVPDSLAVGARIQNGDRVILESPVAN
ncbi:MAG: hypothetical protein ACQKBY_12215 [Verrucomicrobiales bacterium]